jgi:catechol 2,3-dioxygenase-like lactoylglutathione lyase family enzyme
MSNYLGLHRLDHIGLTVPELESAVEYFRGNYGFELLYVHGPYGDAEGDWSVREFELHARAMVERVAMLRLGSLQLELFEWSSPDQEQRMPRQSDHGGHHIAFYVDDVAKAAEHLRGRGVKVIGTVKALPGPEAGPGGEFVFTETPWGLRVELCSYPNGKAYEKPGYTAAAQRLTAPASARA